MAYNFINELKSGEFSWREDYEQTLEDLDAILNRTPFGWITNKLEGKLGQLQLRDKVYIKGVYAYSGLLKGLSLIQYVRGDDLSPRFLLVVSLITDSLALMHHSAMGGRDSYSRQVEE